MTVKKKYFHVELYGDDDTMIQDWKFKTKQEQLKKYHALLGEGYKAGQVVKKTREWYE